MNNIVSFCLLLVTVFRLLPFARHIRMQPHITLIATR